MESSFIAHAMKGSSKEAQSILPRLTLFLEGSKRSVCGVGDFRNPLLSQEIINRFRWDERHSIRIDVNFLLNPYPLSPNHHHFEPLQIQNRQYEWA